MNQMVNIAVREGPGRSVLLTRLPGDRYTKNQGRRTGSVYTGEYEELLEFAQEQYRATAGGGGVQTTWELTQTQGTLGELRVTKEWFDFVPDSSSSSGSDSGGSIGSGSDYGERPGDSPDNPEVTIQNNTVEEPLLSHPKYAELPQETLLGLNAMINGAAEHSTVQLPNGAYKKVADLVSGAGEVLNKIRRGVTHYLEPHTIATVRYKGRGQMKEVGKIGHQAGLPTAGKDRSWLCTGCGVETRGNETWTTTTWELGHWDKDLYS